MHEAKIAEYRAAAAKWQEWAQQEVSQKTRLRWQKMAEEWARMAENFERRSSDIGASSAPSGGN